MEYPTTIENIAKEANLSDFKLGTMATAAALASNKSTVKWNSVYCSEFDTNTWDAAKAEQAYNDAVVTTTVNLPDNNGYVSIAIGVNWFAWGVGDPLASAIMEYFAVAE